MDRRRAAEQHKNAMAHSIKPRRKPSANPLTAPLLMAVAAVFGAWIAGTLASEEQMYIIRPLIVAAYIFSGFAYLLNHRFRGEVVAEVGFLYLTLSVAYTFAPAVGFLAGDFNLPSNVEAFASNPNPAQLGAHLWRHVLFLFGVATGYLVVRGHALSAKPGSHAPRCSLTFVINVMVLLVVCSIAGIYALSAPVETYLDNYVRFQDLSWLSLRLAYVCLIIKSGGYFVVLSLMFSRYRKYKLLIWVLVPVIAVFEVVYSNGARIEALIILFTTLVLYHCKVRPISMGKCAAVLCLITAIFSVVEGARAAIADKEVVTLDRLRERAPQVSEFSAVYNTGFHLYTERARGTLPPRDWRMFFFDLAALVPFIDHIQSNPQYWYARNYFPFALVPPQTMGVIADSGIWGGEVDLLIRSLINGALFALVARWCRPRLDRWWVLIIYAYFYATCIMTLKYSVFYQFGSLIRAVVPCLLLAGVLIWFRGELRPVYRKTICAGADGGGPGAEVLPKA